MKHVGVLTDLQNAGHGSLTLMTGKTGDPRFRETSIDALLGDPGLTTVNDDCQTRLNGIEMQFETELGLTASDIVKIPSLFVEEQLFPLLVSALTPGMVNLLVVTRPSFTDTILAIAKPFGPVLGGVDQFERDVRAKLTPLGYSAARIRFIDDFKFIPCASGRGTLWHELQASSTYTTLVGANEG